MLGRSSESEAVSAMPGMSTVFGTTPEG
jgi:hypothetical protein